MILDAPPKGWRKPIPDSVKVALMLQRYPGSFVAALALGSARARLRMLFFLHGKHEFHHQPGIWERQYDTEKDNTVPAANDPEFMEAKLPAEHRAIEHGPGGERRITSAGSAANRRGKIRRANKPKKRRSPPIRSRGFQKDPNFKRTIGGNVVPRKRR